MTSGNRQSTDRKPTGKKVKELSQKEQSERFIKTARDLEVEGFEIAGEYVEVETGKGSDALDKRPQLKAALDEARNIKAHVIVARPSQKQTSPSTCSAK